MANARQRKKAAKKRRVAGPSVTVRLRAEGVDDVVKALRVVRAEAAATAIALKRVAASLTILTGLAREYRKVVEGARLLTGLRRK